MPGDLLQQVLLHEMVITDISLEELQSTTVDILECETANSI